MWKAKFQEIENVENQGGFHSILIFSYATFTSGEGQKRRGMLLITSHPHQIIFLFFKYMTS